MNHPGTAVAGVDPHIEQAGARCFLAVQQDTAVTCVDWEVFHGWTLDDPDFAGMITVQDGDGAQVGRADWTVPTEAAADRCLAGLGWRRVGAWSWDWAGPPSGRPGHRGVGRPGPGGAVVVAGSVADRRVSSGRDEQLVSVH